MVGKNKKTPHRSLLRTVGKWHLGFKEEKFENLLGEIYPRPNDYGFDFSFSLPNNLDDGHKVYVENNEIYGLRSDKKYVRMENLFMEISTRAMTLLSGLPKMLRTISPAKPLNG